MWISLPKAGATLVGYPFLEPTDITTCLMTDGSQTVTLEEAMANGWFDGMAQGWDSTIQSYVPVGVFPWYSHQLDPFHGYWITTYQDNLALIIPAPAS
jgi:hypothetical protein